MTPPKLRRWICVLSLVLAVPGSGQEVQTHEGPWLLEEQFASNPALHATVGQTIVLHLEGRESGLAIAQNFAQLLVEERSSYTFCIDADEPYITSLEVTRLAPPASSSGEQTTWVTYRGRPCDPLVLVPGSYLLRVEHDASRVPAGGRKAFFHKPEQVQLVGEVAGADPFETPDFFVLRGPNGKFVTDASPSPLFALATTVSSVGLHEVWQITEEATSFGQKYALRNGLGTEVRIFTPLEGDIPVNNLHTGVVTGSKGVELKATLRFQNVQVGSLQLEMAVAENGTVENSGVQVVGPDGDLEFGAANQTTFTYDYKGFAAGHELSLQQGEVALYAQCDFQGPAIVFHSEIGDLSVYDAAAQAGFAIGDDMAASVRVGPNTIVFLYEDAGLSGTEAGIGADVACLDTTAIGSGTASSLKVLSRSSYLASATSCDNCVLTGIDFSSQDLSGISFPDANFSGANLTDTSFVGSNLTEASFSGPNTLLQGTDFSSTDLRCTSFESADVTGASFTDSSVPTDFSGRVGFASATLDYSNFSPEVWRYFDLSNSTMESVPQILSSVAEPLDLSGAILDDVTWLSGKTLDGVVLGCTAATDAEGAPSLGSPICTSLQRADLSNTSLVTAQMQFAQLQGATLDFSNLDGADLSSSKLLGLPNGGSPASMVGAFLRDASLAGADLSGVVADHVNFYSSLSGTADATDATMTGAKFNGAYLANANFGGASSTLQSTEWTQAVLVGANFTCADLTKNETADEATDFTGAYLQGAIFTNAKVTGAKFGDTYWDLSGSGTLNFQLPASNLQFAGYWNDPSAPECVSATYPTTTFPSPEPPSTSNSETCPNGSLGPCDAVWEMPQTPIDQALPPSAVSPAVPGACTTTDLLWLFGQGG